MMEPFSLPHTQNKKGQAHLHEEEKQELGKSSTCDCDTSKSNQYDY
jgi:hypothetical protein